MQALLFIVNHFLHDLRLLLQKLVLLELEVLECLQNQLPLLGRVFFYFLVVLFLLDLYLRLEHSVVSVIDNIQLQFTLMKLIIQVNQLVLELFELL